jgi:hypothetical protein
MTIRRQVKPKSATASIEAVETKAKRMVADLTLLKHEIREAERAGGSKRDLELINSRLYMLQQSGWAIRDLLNDFADEVREAINAPEAPAQLRLAGGR